MLQAGVRGYKKTGKTGQRSKKATPISVAFSGLPIVVTNKRARKSEEKSSDLFPQTLLHNIEAKKASPRVRKKSKRDQVIGLQKQSVCLQAAWSRKEPTTCGYEDMKLSSPVKLKIDLNRIGSQRLAQSGT